MECQNRTFGCLLSATPDAKKMIIAGLNRPKVSPKVTPKSTVQPNVRFGTPTPKSAILGVLGALLPNYKLETAYFRVKWVKIDDGSDK